MRNKKRQKLYSMTNGEKYSYYKRQTTLAFTGKWVSVIAPFLIMFVAKFNTYIEIVQNESTESFKLTIGCILALIVAAIAVLSELKRDSSLKNISPVFGWGLAALFSFLFAICLQDLTEILFAEFVGQCSSVACNVLSKKSEEEAKSYMVLAKQDGTYLAPKRKETNAGEILG